MLKTCPSGKEARTPARDDLFEVDAAEEACGESVRKEFHRNVARIMYLAKRARPDCLAAVSFLATRVQRCTSTDLAKLDRLVRYIRTTKKCGFIMRPGKDYTTVSVNLISNTRANSSSQHRNQHYANRFFARAVPYYAPSEDF